MPIFGQVWLWSSLAFLLGALLCWGLVALPARRRVGELEAELSDRFRRQPPGEHLAERPFERLAERPVDSPVDRRGDRRADRRAERAEPRHRMREEPEAHVPELLKSPPPKLPDLPREPIGRTQALPTREPGRSVRPGSFPGFGSDFNALGEASGGFDMPAPFADPSETELADGPRGGPGRRGWFDDEPGASQPLEPMSRLGTPESDAPEVDRRLVDDEAEAPGESTSIIFSQHTRPIPDELIREMDTQTPAAEPQPAYETYGQPDEPAEGLVDDLDDEDVPSAADQTVESEPVPSPPGSLAEPAASAESVESATEPAAEPEVPVEGAHDQTAVLPAVTVPPIERILERPTKPADDDSPSGVGTGQRPDLSKVMSGVTIRPDPTAAPLPKRVPNKTRGHTPFGVELSQAAAESQPSSEPTRALFEPVRPADDDPVIPPPHRVRGGDANGRGPFGPGSAMPLPGGDSPSPEFTIKASVSALRYCTPESPQFDRTVAEVWFKSPADAERVGFRPVG